MTSLHHRSEIQTQEDFGTEFPNKAAEYLLKFPKFFPHKCEKHTSCLTSDSGHLSIY